VDAEHLGARPLACPLKRSSRYLRREIFINPVTYAYAGQLETAIRAHTGSGLDGNVSVHAGEVLADDAILTSQIVGSPGER
jgi:hypothetical protein